MRRIWGLLLLAALLAVAVATSLMFGNRALELGQVFAALGNSDGVSHLWHGRSGTPLSDPDDIIWDLRVPRTLLGLMVGLAIGAAGALIQGHTRNPLADPGLLGINAGAALAVVAGAAILGSTTPLGNTALGLFGAIIASALVFGLASVTGSSPLTLVLAGTGLSAFLVAITSAIVLSDGASMETWRFWNVGAIANRDISVFWSTLPFLIVGLLLALASGFFLNILSLGDDMATALGSRILQVRMLGILAITLLAGASTAACGPITFLGLVVPHLARPFTGPDYRWIVPCSALIGAILMLFCDVLGRILGRPGEIQVGVMLALVGAPMLIALIRRRKLPAV